VNTENHPNGLRFTRNLSLLFLMMVLGFHANADYFKWELEVFAEGPGTQMETIPVIGRESLFKWGKDGNCSISDAWTRLEPELTIEGKTLLCEKGEERKSVSLICRDNRSARRYNRAKEIYPEPLTANLLLDEPLAHESAYLRFRCYF